MRVAFVLPRYGASLGGGAETLARELLLRFFARGIFQHVEVWTTCARDHRTWENFHPAGTTQEDGIPIKRFPVDERDLEPFIRAEHRMARGEKLSIAEQIGWIENSVNSRALYSHISREGRNFDLLFFAPYLFATTFWGALIHPDKSILIPCLHDESYAYNQIFAVLFSRVRGFFFNAEGERRLAEKIYPDLTFRGGVVGMGMPLTPAAPSMTVDGLIPKQYFLYSGRKELGKNVDLMLEYYESLDAEFRRRFPLVLIGSGSIDFRSSLPEGVLDLGFVSEEKKRTLMRGALALIQPSTNESFSIVLLEALEQETPVVVHSQCAVTADHARVGNCGLAFENGDEFAVILKLLAEENQIGDALGRQGRRYVEEEHSWEAVERRALDALCDIGMIPHGLHT